MQEVALAAVRQQAPLADPTKVGPWLYRLAVRQTLLYRRGAGRRRKLTDRYANRFRPTETDEHACDPLDWLLADNVRGWGIVGLIWLLSLTWNLVTCRRRKPEKQPQNTESKAKSKPAVA